MRITILSVFCILGIGAIALAADNLPMPGFYSIHEIKKSKPGSTYTTQGYVVYKYQCPPCPDGAQCKPCMRENVVISEQNKIFENYNDLGDTELVVLAEKTGELQLGEKYYFIVSTHGSAGDSSDLRAEGGSWWQEGESSPPLGSGVSD